MKRKIQRIINKCLPCLRNDVLPTKNHPALFLKVLQIFDLLGIDLVFGLPLTEEGFHGCLIIINRIHVFLIIKINIQNIKDNIQAINQLQLAENDFRLQILMKLHFSWNIQHFYFMKSYFQFVKH
jgi:hypothetical protein